MITISRILYPTDFSEYSAHARHYAIELAKKFDATIVALHAVPLPVSAASYEIVVDMTSMRDMMEEAAHKRLAEEAEQIQAAGVNVETVVRVGTAFVEIVDVAQAQQVDLIVIATHGWGALKHLLLGSTAERIVRKAPCPVLTVRHPEHEFVHPAQAHDRAGE